MSAFNKDNPIHLLVDNGRTTVLKTLTKDNDWSFNNIGVWYWDDSHILHRLYPWTSIVDIIQYSDRKNDSDNEDETLAEVERHDYS